MVTRGDIAKAMARPGGREETVLQAGSDSVIVACPDELLEDAVVKMVRNHVGRLPVVDRRDPARILGYLGRHGIVAALGRRLDEEHVREPGRLALRVRFLRSRNRQRKVSREAALAPRRAESVGTVADGRKPE